MNKSKWIIITGASRGLGENIFKRIIKDTKFNVIAISRSGLNLKFDKSRVEDIKFDLKNIDELPSLLKEITKDKIIFGCINNAGIGSNSILPTQRDKEIQNVICCNLTAPIIISKYASRQMFKNGHGKIINIASVVAHTGYNGLATYAATKAGLIGFTKSLARELGKANISVNSISPGFMITDMTDGLGSRMNQIKRRSPVNQLPELDDVSDIIIFLLNQKNSRHTGHDFIVDAGNSI